MDTDEIKMEQAIDIVTDEIACLMNEYSINKDREKDKEYKEKIDVLEKIKDEVYLGNKNIIDKVIEKRKEGNL